MLDETGLIKLQNADIESCDKNSLTDIKNINIDADQPSVSKMKSFVEHVGNPYLFKVGEIAVKLEFEGGVSFNKAFANLIRTGLEFH